MSEANTSGSLYDNDATHEGRDSNFMDIDRMINEGLGGGTVSYQNGLIEETTTDTMHFSESVTGGGTEE
ncbi:hypothetical protein [Paenibacillus mucilaginosus]|uniref:Uncharacterized protein n=3 Tax=Paenibacillus mucilaginosus TaxID=61624 RepID=H6NQN5_9BACL|nr:hypothetical protein [Paenibacillus mucilaginosus]AFC33503.1 hypothetical protein PM3016_6906 [Paenibacillus mucilaginosus 3016]MCG7217808.1 hypothetical protein [Paenibacillus mucilaginosus]WDM27220.1 hypothetical protein KCX80_33320 [Paenibacillus mucilaginosus]